LLNNPVTAYYHCYNSYMLHQ